MQPNLTIIINDVEDDYQIIKFTGEFDKAGHSYIRDELDNAVKNFTEKFLVFDFSGLKFINSEGIGYIMEIHTHLRKRDKKLIIVGLSSHVADVFKTIGISEIIPIYEDMDDFKNNK
ncbi:anti-sigma factor antagonist [Candidatus Peregrinibacteria bacterium]|nr:anti-sigma factor antagonist [Candidatus Peregrinibacteria bacterium]